MTDALQRMPAPTFSTRASCRVRPHGLTLLEILIVLALMATIAAIAVPVFSGGVSNAELKSSAREIAAGLRFARSEAIAGKRDTVVVYDLARRTFVVDRDPREHALPRGVEMKLTGAQSDIVNEHVGAIRFFPDGGSNGGRVTIAAGERKFDVDIDWLTGRVAIND
jgi:general secretion pathway protein H